MASAMRLDSVSLGNQCIWLPTHVACEEYNLLSKQDGISLATVPYTMNLYSYLYIRFCATA
jgi:hypothetical protein